MEPPEGTQEAQASAPDYYQVLGVDPAADAAAIDAAYHGRSLRFRVGQLRQRTQDLSGPTQEEIEQAYSILGHPESRTLYDAVYYPDKARPAPARRRFPPWIWAVAAVWVVAIIVVACVGVRSKLKSDDGAIARLVSLTATAVAANPPIVVTPTAPATVLAVVSPTATDTPAPRVAVASPAPPPPAPTATATVAPTATATIPPTATPTVAPTATPVPPTPTPEPPPTEAPEPPAATPEPPEPPPPPAFQPTDRIGVSVNVNLRNGPGTNYPSLGPLTPGTLLQATGQTAVTGGQLWRRFKLEDGRVGWVRDIDVLPVR